jgi:hypothetical protein
MITLLHYITLSYYNYRMITLWHDYNILQHVHHLVTGPKQLLLSYDHTNKLSCYHMITLLHYYIIITSSYYILHITYRTIKLW